MAIFLFLFRRVFITIESISIITVTSSSNICLFLYSNSKFAFISTFYSYLSFLLFCLFYILFCWLRYFCIYYKFNLILIFVTYLFIKQTFIVHHLQAFTISSKWWMKYSASFIVMHNEGCKRRTLAPAPPLPNNIHLSLNFSRI